MAPFTASHTDASASLSAMHASLHALRDALNTYATPPHPPPKLLSHAIVVKTAHDRILSDVAAARAQTHNDQQLLLRSRQRLSSLRYERAMLEREIARCRATPSPSLDALTLALPAPPPGDTTDIAVSCAHADALATLNDDLAKRRAVGSEVDAVVQAAADKREALRVARERLRNLPDAMRSLADVVEPVRKLLDADAGALANAAEVAEAGRLAAPLYVLAREAFAYRAFFVGRLAVAIVGDDENARKVPAGGEAGGKAAAALYQAHALRVRVDVYAEGEGSAPWLEVTFAWLERLQVVCVRARLARVQREPGETGADAPLCTRELDQLFPHDAGWESPNASNAHLEEGRFAFSHVRAGGGRPYVWANVVCGLPYLQALEGKGAFDEWPRVAGREAAHVKFRDVAERLQGRLRWMMALEREVRILREGKWAEDGELRATVRVFENVEDREVEGEGWRSVWRVVVEGRGGRVEGQVEGGAGEVRFRLSGGAEEAVLREIEMKVNVASKEDEGGSGLLAGVTALRRAVDGMGRRGGEKGKLPASLAKLMS